MDLCRHIKARPPVRSDMIAAVNMIVLVVAFFFAVSLSVFAVPLNVRLPKAVTSDMVNAMSVTIVVTSENILYLDDKVTTLQELRDFLGRPGNKSRSLLIKADRRASVGRVVDIWDLGRNLGIEQISIAADQEE